MSDLDQILRDFDGDMERAEHLLGLVKSFREFGASTVPMAVADGSEPWPEAIALSAASHSRRTDLPILAGSLLLYLAGRFEYFVRQLVEAVADELAAKAAKYSDLPATLKSELRARTLDVATNPRRYGFDEGRADAVLESLVSNMAGAKAPVTVSSNVLSITEANMKDRILSDLMKRVGITEFWREVGKQARLKLHLAKLTDGDTTLEAQNQLNRLMDDRNQIAHPTAATTFPDADAVLGVAKFLRVFGSVSTDVMRVQLAGLIAATPKPAAASAVAVPVSVPVAAPASAPAATAPLPVAPNTAAMADKSPRGTGGNGSGG